MSVLNSFSSRVSYRSLCTCLLFVFWLLYSRFFYQWVHVGCCITNF